MVGGPLSERKGFGGGGGEWRAFRKGGFSCNSRFVLQPAVAIVSEVSISSGNSLATTDFLAKKTLLVNYHGNPPSWNPPHS